MIYRFRVILNSQDEVFRDIEIEENETFEDFHNAITQAFGFEGLEVASFYESNEEWEQKKEIALFEMGEGEDAVKTMANTKLNHVLSADHRNLVYIYDFMSMWTFIIELADIAEPEIGILYPNLMFAQGEIPLEPQDPEFVSESMHGDDQDDDNFDDEFDAENYDDLDFDEHWN
ncbi:IS1096 element passenger TnpR family protein [Patiriisocius sp. Uisw_017]|jgi:hypothetical protein|uniref:IS1096 element passenger TnpR family protein n=1 Tax=Patiriisocius sp. Uisw_017 TaxID=3230968 RepID=UPI0039ECCACB